MKNDLVWLYQDGPAVDWHIESNGVLHIVLRCDWKTDITNNGNLTSAVEMKKIWDAVDRHQQCAGCQCLTYMHNVMEGIRAAVTPPFDADDPNPTRDSDNV